MGVNNMSNICPVCQKESTKIKCENCGFEKSAFAFLSEEDANKWYKDIVLPYRDNLKKRNCKNCGKELKDEWKVCPYCGTSVTEEASVGDFNIPSGIKIELIDMLSYMDYLLEFLPEDKIEEFARSKYFDTYKKFFKKLGLVEQQSGDSQQFGNGWGNELGYKMVLVHGGSFQMGDTAGGGRDDELPSHTVTLSDFYIGKYEVTQALYQSVMGTNPSSGYGVGNNYPVYNVKWYDAVEFANKLSEREGRQPVYTVNGKDVKWNQNADGYRLPTEAEWEYAAKGGNRSPGNYTYAGSNNVDSVAWYANNSGNSTHPVGTKAPNSLGLYDMSGNVWEWCWDWYGSYSSKAQNNPLGASSGSDRVLRGGSWGDSAGDVRSAYRGYLIPRGRGEILGFRLVRP